MNSTLEILTRAKAVGYIVADVESNHADVHKDDWCFDGIGIGSGGLVNYITDPREALDVIRCLWVFEGWTVAHNAQFDLQAMKKFSGLRGYPLKPGCTMIATNLCDDNLRETELGLKKLVPRLFDHKMVTYAEALEFGKDSPEFADYCARGDCYWTEKLWLWARQRLEAEGIWKYYEKIMSEAVKVVCDMQTVGVGYDLEQARKVGIVYNAVVGDARRDLQETMGSEINLNSPDQVAKRLYEDLGVPTAGVKKTKGGKNKEPRFTVDVATMDMLALKGFEVCKKYSRYNHLTKMLSTYVVSPAYFALKDPNFRVHPNTWLTSATGRTRQNKPTMQTTPVSEDDGTPDGKLMKTWLDTKCKALFGEVFDLSLRSPVVARPGHVLSVADWSQQQLRICAHVTGDPHMMGAYTSWQCRTCGAQGDSAKLLLSCPQCGAQADKKILKGADKSFWHGLDIHAQTLADIPILHGRQDAKTCNFELIFNAMAWTLSQRHPEHTETEWEAIIRAYFTKYIEVKRYHVDQEWLMDDKGECQDMFGRKRRITRDMIRKARKHCLNQVINAPIQMPEVGIALLAATRIRRELIEKQMWAESATERGATLIHINHDELILEEPLEMADAVEEIQMRHMRDCVQLRVPLDAELKRVWRWSEAKG